MFRKSKQKLQEMGKMGSHFSQKKLSILVWVAFD
jgi:hypothetical protein